MTENFYLPSSMNAAGAIGRSMVTRVEFSPNPADVHPLTYVMLDFFFDEAFVCYS